MRRRLVLLAYLVIILHGTFALADEVGSDVCPSVMPSTGPLRVKVRAAVYRGRGFARGRRFVRIRITETNTSRHGVPVAMGCQIFGACATAEDGTVVWVYRSMLLCATYFGILDGGASRRLHTAAGPLSLEPGRYTVTAFVDGVADSTTIRVRR